MKKQLILPLVLALSLISYPSNAATGFNLNLENLFAPLGKQVGQFQENSADVQSVFGRATTEFIGVSGFTDINVNWRLLYGFNFTQISQPIFKASGSLAFMINTPYKIPMRPYVFLGVDPVVSANPSLPSFGFTSHGGLGLDYTWDNKLYTQILLKLYLLPTYGEEDASLGDFPTQWQSGTLSLSAGAGYIF